MSLDNEVCPLVPTSPDLDCGWSLEDKAAALGESLVSEEGCGEALGLFAEAVGVVVVAVEVIVEGEEPNREVVAVDEVGLVVLHDNAVVAVVMVVVAIVLVTPVVEHGDLGVPAVR